MCEKIWRTRENLREEHTRTRENMAWGTSERITRTCEKSRKTHENHENAENYEKRVKGLWEKHVITIAT